MSEYLDLIQHPEKTPTLTQEGKLWAAGLFVGEQYLNADKADPHTVHIAISLEWRSSDYPSAFRFNQVPSVFGFDQVPTIEDIDINLFKNGSVGMWSTNAELLCPTRHPSAVITPLYPNFQQIMKDSLSPYTTLPHMRNAMCRRCVSSYHALSGNHMSKKEKQRADRLLRGIGMRQLKGLTL